MKEPLYITPYSIFGLCSDTRVTDSSRRAHPFPLSKFSKPQHIHSLLALDCFYGKSRKKTHYKQSLPLACLVTWISDFDQ